MGTALNDRRLARVAGWGAAFAVVVVAASALLRLGTRLDAGGNAVSMLPAALESLARLAHRVSASLVALAALAAVVLAIGARPVPCGRRAALAAIVVATVVLAAIGRYTPGYRFLGVTVANATLGVLLAAAFAFLRARATDGARKGVGVAPLVVLVAALAVWAAIRYRGGIAAIAAAQLALGIALAALGASRGVPGEWLHAMLACALAIALASRAAART